MREDLAWWLFGFPAVILTGCGMILGALGWWIWFQIQIRICRRMLADLYTAIAAMERRLEVLRRLAEDEGTEWASDDSR